MELKVPQVEGSKVRPRPRLWGGCYRGVFAICLVTLTLPQLGGTKGFLALNVRGMLWGRFRNLGGGSHSTPNWKMLRGASALEIGGDAVGMFLQSGL